MNFTDLKNELYARGTDYLSEDAEGVARAERWLNQAYREMLGFQPWPFLQTAAVGNVGEGSVSVPDLRKILFVWDASAGAYPLKRVSLEDLSEEDGVAAVTGKTGTPEYYWLDGENIIKTYPTGGTIIVRYIKRVPPMSGTDEPLFDEEYHDLIVDRAMMKAYKDSDNFEALAALRVEYEAGVAQMTEDYMLSARQVQYIEPSGSDV